MSTARFEEFKSNPAAISRLWRDLGPVLYSPDIDRWLITRYEAVEKVLRSQSAANGDGSERGQILISRNGEHHRVPRRGILAGLTSDILDTLEAKLREIARSSVRSSLSMGHIDGVKSISWSISNSIFSLLFGSDAPDARVRSRWNQGIVNNGWVDVPQPTRWLASLVGLRKAKRMLFEPTYQDYREVRRYVEHHFAAAKTSSEVTELTRSLLNLHSSGIINEEELIAIGLEFIFATTEAPSAMFSGLLLHLADNEELFRALRSDPKSIGPFVEEVLRFESPGQWLRRTAMEEIVIDDVAIPAGAGILALIASANRDSDVFPDAERFDAGRSPNPHIAFGIGPHGCPGARLARLEARVFLEEFLDLVGTVRRSTASPRNEYRWLFAIRSLSQLKLQITAR